MLGAIVVARIPITDVVIDEMLGSSEHTAASFLDHILCLVYWKRGETIRAMHASVLDYLSDPRRSGNYPWFIDVSSHHHILSKRCFSIMNAELHFNISRHDSSLKLKNFEEDPSGADNDGDSVIPVTERLKPNSLVYAIQYWADHAYRAVVVSGDDRHHKIDEGEAESLRECIDDFMRSRFLYWLEVLILLATISHASPMLRTTAQWIRVSTT